MSAKLAHANGICTSSVFGMACLAGSEVNIVHIYGYRYRYIYLCVYIQPVYTDQPLLTYTYLCIYLNLSVYIHQILCFGLFLFSSPVTVHEHILETFNHTGWDDKIVALEKMIWFHFRLMKTCFVFFVVADHLLVGQLCTNPKNDRRLLSYLKVTQCSTSEIGNAPLYNSGTLPIQVMRKGSLPAPSKCKSGRFNAWGHSSTHQTTLWKWYYLPTPPLGQDMTQGQFLSGV